MLDVPQGLRYPTYLGHCFKYMTVNYNKNHDGEIDVACFDDDERDITLKNKVLIGYWPGLWEESKHIINDIDIILETIMNKQDWLGLYNRYQHNCFDFLRAFVRTLNLELTAKHEKYDSATKFGLRRLFGGFKKQKEKEKQASYTDLL